MAVGLTACLPDPGARLDSAALHLTVLGLRADVTDVRAELSGASDFDRDGDGFTACSGDCDDRRADRNPNSVEVCDGVDNDCDGLVDNADACF